MKQNAMTNRARGKRCEMALARKGERRAARSNDDPPSLRQPPNYGVTGEALAMALLSRRE
jgi:hypothetical protein